jgi:hypothetical protein
LSKSLHGMALPGLGASKHALRKWNRYGFKSKESKPLVRSEAVAVRCMQLPARNSPVRRSERPFPSARRGNRGGRGRARVPSRAPTDTDGCIRVTVRVPFLKKKSSPVLGTVISRSRGDKAGKYRKSRLNNLPREVTQKYKLSPRNWRKLVRYWTKRRESDSRMSLPYVTYRRVARQVRVIVDLPPPSLRPRTLPRWACGVCRTFCPRHSPGCRRVGQKHVHG